MLKTVWAVIREGSIHPLEPIDLHEGKRALVTLLPDEEKQSWTQASQASLDSIWDNTEDDVYAELLEE